MPDSKNHDLMVVFDVDDTLYLEREYVASGFDSLDRSVQSKFGKSGFSKSAWHHFSEGARGNIFDLALTDVGVRPDKKVIGELVEEYRNHQPAISLHADARETLDKLVSMGVRIGVLTDGPSASQTNKLKALGLGDLAEIAIVTDLYGPGFGKPHVRGFQEIEERSGCARFVYVADNPHKDFIAPRTLKWRTVRIIRAGGLHAGLTSTSDVDVEITSLHSLITNELYSW